MRLRPVFPEEWVMMVARASVSLVRIFEERAISPMAGEMASLLIRQMALPVYGTKSGR
jgi:hypothetical protein